LEIGLLVYPRHTPLDLVGPWEVLVRVPDSTTHLIWTRPGPVQAEGGIEITATTGFADAPPLDLLLVPGGPGQLSLMKHTLLMDYIRSCSASAQWICSVCTGALLLAQAGVLKGRRATTHWLAREALRSFDVDVRSDRYVLDGKFATSAGVSAGIDLALELARRLAGDEVAQEIQLQLEYDPLPRLATGAAESAPPELLSRLRSRARRYR
jgi:transcriptional regulator GlxA family with amidase domain